MSRLARCLLCMLVSLAGLHATAFPVSDDTTKDKVMLTGEIGPVVT